MYTKAASKQELAAFGLTESDFAAETTEIWPENYQSYLVFSNMSTQWRMGMNGATGLDYNVLPEIWRRLKVDTALRDAIFADIRVMELAAINQMNENRDSK